MGLPTGVIILWSGSIVNIPAGFVLCDGNNDTPDLRDKFIAGAGSTYNPDAEGGAVEHDHDFTANGHTHAFGGAPSLQGGANKGFTVSTEFVTGTTDNESNLPPYYALAYIMKT